MDGVRVGTGGVGVVFGVDSVAAVIAVVWVVGCEYGDGVVVVVGTGVGVVVAVAAVVVAVVDEVSVVGVIIVFGCVGGTVYS